MNSEEPKKQLGEMLEKLHRFIRQRPGLEFGNYGDAAIYRAELRTITRDKRDAEAMLFYVWRSQMTPEQVGNAAKSAFSGRLTWDGEKWEYVTGQYFPTEYRKAAAAVLARSLFEYFNEGATSPKTPRERAFASAKNALGVGVAKRWFA